jgi:glycosyltransferase involved in cell wall biosynthesis
MNILLITWYFPPGNDVAALRTGAMAKHLELRGHRVQVLTSDRFHSDSSLAVPVDESSITRTRWFDIDDRRMMPQPAERLVNNRKSPRRREPRSLFGKAYALAATTYYNLIHIPDRYVGWAPFAVATANRIVREQDIDLIYASAPPFTAYLVANAVARRQGLPWIAEYRDGWSRYLYAPKPGWRQWIDERMENHTLKSAAGIVAVTESWADYYQQRYGKPTAAVPNGFDAQMLCDGAVVPAPGRPVTITYVGFLYEGLRDPSALYQGIRLAGFLPDELEVNYYGPSEEEVFARAKEHGVADHVHVLPRVGFAESLAIQRQSDILLLLQAPGDPRNVPAKLFEYFASHRPILGVGLDSGEPARLINERGAGLYSSDPGVIASQLRAWIDEKRRTGAISATPESASVGLSREEQLDKVNTFIGTVAAGGAGVRRAKVHRIPRAVALARVPGRPSADDRPYLVTTVDAEEAFDWHQPLSRELHKVTSMREHEVLHRVFEKYKVVPTYFATYPIVMQDDGWQFLAECLKDCKCEIGTQLHAWVTPPFDEAVNAYNSFAGNLPELLEFAKLKALTDAIANRFDMQPTAYRAGRYGIGPNTVRLLNNLGYRVDSSVTPEFSFRGEGGPTFLGWPPAPYWLDDGRTMLELPLTSSCIGWLSGDVSYGRHLADRLFDGDKKFRVAKAFLARSRMMERIRLSPEGSSVSDARRLVRALLKRGINVFVMSYHSPSLIPGNTPYVRTLDDRARFLQWFDGFFEFFFGEIGGSPATVSEIYKLASAHQVVVARQGASIAAAS